MNDPEALIFASRGKQPDQSAIRSLLRLGLVQVDDVTTLDSTSREFFITAITAKGKRFVEATEAVLKQKVIRQ
jgi:hypothetical protein